MKRQGGGAGSALAFCLFALTGCGGGEAPGDASARDGTPIEGDGSLYALSDFEFEVRRQSVAFRVPGVEAWDSIGSPFTSGEVLDPELYTLDYDGFEAELGGHRILLRRNDDPWPVGSFLYIPTTGPSAWLPTRWHRSPDGRHLLAWGHGYESTPSPFLRDEECGIWPVELRVIELGSRIRDAPWALDYRFRTPACEPQLDAVEWTSDGQVRLTTTDVHGAGLTWALVPEGYRWRLQHGAVEVSAVDGGYTTRTTPRWPDELNPEYGSVVYRGPALDAGWHVWEWWDSGGNLVDFWGADRRFEVELATGTVREPPG